MVSLVSSPHRDLVFSPLFSVSRVLRPHTLSPLGPSHTQKNQGEGLVQVRVMFWSTGEKTLLFSTDPPTPQTRSTR